MRIDSTVGDAWEGPGDRSLGEVTPRIEGTVRQSSASQRGRIWDSASVLALGSYLLVAILIFGRSLRYPFDQHYVGLGPDPSEYIWLVNWWVYSIRHHLNPLFTSMIFPPEGVNLTWTTTMPLAGVAAAPITSVAGPIAAYNCLALIAPASAAWTTFLLCRELSGRFWPSLLGGYSFGFSAYILAHTAAGHPILTLVFPVPLALYVATCWFDGTIRSGIALVLFSGLMAALFYLSLEVFATSILVAGLALCFAISATRGEVRRRVLQLIVILAGASLLAFLATVPFLYCLFAYGWPRGPLQDSVQFSADIVNYLLPTRINWLGMIPPLRMLSEKFPGIDFERTAYLGPALIGIAVAYVYRHWREPFGRILLDVLVAVVVLSCGPVLHFEGLEVVAMPGKLLAVLPTLDKALPVRFTMFVSLIVAIMMALWFASSHTRASFKGVVAALVILCSLPNPRADRWATKVDTPGFFADGLYRKYLTPNEVVMITPYWLLGRSMLWQAESGMYFRMAGGYSGLVPNNYRRWPVVRSLTEWSPLPEPQDQLMAFLANHDVRAIIVNDDDPDRALWHRWLPPAFATPIEVGGVDLYQIPAAALTAYRSVTAAAAEQRALSSLFARLLAAAAQYRADGYRPEGLTPFSAERLGLIPSDWLPDPVWVPEWMAGTKFDVTLDIDQPMYRGMWLGYVGNYLGIGIRGTYEGLKPLIERYRADAYRVYYPFPRPFVADVHGDDSGFLLMFFDANGMQRAIAHSASSAAPAAGAPGS